MAAKDGKALISEEKDDKVLSERQHVSSLSLGILLKSIIPFID